VVAVTGWCDSLVNDDKATMKFMIEVYMKVYTNKGRLIYIEAYNGD